MFYSSLPVLCLGDAFTGKLVIPAIFCVRDAQLLSCKISLACCIAASMRSKARLILVLMEMEIE